MILAVTPPISVYFLQVPARWRTWRLSALTHLLVHPPHNATFIHLGYVLNVHHLSIPGGRTGILSIRSMFLDSSGFFKLPALYVAARAGRHVGNVRGNSALAGVAN